jgi:hypothetical protein
VKFSPGVLDLLAFTEHCSYVHVVDARNYTDEQIIRVSTPPVSPDTPSIEREDQDITGFSFSPNGNKMIVGTTSSILEYDVHTAMRRTFFSEATVI